LIKTPSSPARASSTKNTPAKSNANQKSAAFLPDPSAAEVIVKGPDLFKKGRNNFNDFRKPTAETSKQESKGMHLASLGEDDDDPLETDELGRDPQDMERERRKTAEEVRVEDELADRIGRFHLKRSLSTTSFKSEEQRTTPPPAESASNVLSPSRSSRQKMG
jgi:hypothetical protein